MSIPLPETVSCILGQLNAAGYEAYAVGGCVRDSLLGRTPEDWDICTSALPQEVMACFPQCKIHTVGLKHGTVLLMLEGRGYEVTTYRTDGPSSDHRHPDGVQFVRSLEEDLARRDFTINAMAYHPVHGLVDPFSGQTDLAAGIVRCVGEPKRRFREDGLRILRGLRFASRYGFQIETETGAAIRQQAELLQFISGERIFAELKGFLAGEGAAQLLLDYREPFGAIMPELVPMFGHPQHNPHHCYDVWGHTCHAVGQVAGDPLLGLTMLLHDAGKPRCFTQDENGVGHFHGHPAESVKIAADILARFHCDNRSRDTILTLIAWHDRVRVFTRRSVRRMLSSLGEENARLLFRVMYADARAQSPATLPQKLAGLAEGERILEELLAEKACFTLKDLAVSGKDLLALGYPAGPELGAALNALLEAVVEERLPNQRQALLDALPALEQSGQLPPKWTKSE
ncbi:MAG: HD domain-containing protein [Clostridiales bacterium]|nr:HD domain-containing protein [Clostridiales bacterium]